MALLCMSSQMFSLSNKWIRLSENNYRLYFRLDFSTCDMLLNQRHCGLGMNPTSRMTRYCCSSLFNIKFNQKNSNYQQTSALFPLKWYSMLNLCSINKDLFILTPAMYSKSHACSKSDIYSSKKTKGGTKDGSYICIYTLDSGRTDQTSELKEYVIWSKCAMGGQIGGSLESTITVLAFMFLEQNDGHVYELTASTSGNDFYAYSNIDFSCVSSCQKINYLFFFMM